jgi:hypothetical protein
MSMRVKPIAPAAALLVLLVAGGCAKEEPPVIEAAFPETPKETFDIVALNLGEHHPEILWEALPPSYRQDVTELTTLFVETMDAEVYDRAFTVMNRAVEVLHDKKEMVLQSSTLAATGVDPEEVDRVWTSSLLFAGTFLNSEISTLGGLGAVDWEQYLATTGHDLMLQAGEFPRNSEEDPYALLASAEAEIVTATDESATMRITVPDEDPEEIDLVRVEDRWIPAEMANQWPEAVATAREQLQSMTPEQIEGLKTQAMFGLGMAEGVIEQVAAMESLEQFDAMMGPMLESVLGMVMEAIPEQE